jgi:membrane associated rhomboid family serine protease
MKLPEGRFGQGGREPILGDIPAEVAGLGALIVIVSAAALAGPRDIAYAIYSACTLMLGSPSPPPQPLGPYAPYLLDALVHGGWAHLGLNMAGLAAFGTGAARRLRSPTLFVLLFALCCIAGSLAEAVLPRTQPTSVIGASAGVFGLVAAATYARFGPGPLPSLFSPAMLQGLAPWVALNLLIPVGGSLIGGVGIAWAAHLGGLAAGALLFPAFDRLAHR